MQNDVTLQQVITWLQNDPLISDTTKQELVRAAERRMEIIAKIVEQNNEYPTTITERICERIYYDLREGV